MEQAGCWHLWEQMTEDQQSAVGKCLLRWADGFHEFSPAGQGCIPDPRQTEIDRLQKQLKTERSEAEEREWIYQDHIAGRRSVHVGIQYGQVTIEPKR